MQDKVNVDFMRTCSQLVDDYSNAGVGKTKRNMIEFIVLAIMAGAFIAIGGSSSSLAVHAIENAGVAKLVAGCIFPVGLMMIVFVGGELFTGDCMMIIGVVDKKYKLIEMVKRLIIVFLGNLVGALIIVCLVYYAGQYDMGGGALAAYTIKVAYGKATISFGKAVCSGIMCNVLVCIAVLMGMASKDAAGKIFGIFFPIMAFVVGGYEHCVANMYYIPAGLLAMTNPNYVSKAMELYGYTAEQLSSLNIYNFLVTSMIPVVIGNIIGGSIFVGLSMVITNKTARAK